MGIQLQMKQKEYMQNVGIVGELGKNPFSQHKGENAMNKKRPSWWPECPCPLNEEYLAMRQGWDLCEAAIWKCLKDGTSIYDKLREILLNEE